MNRFGGVIIMQTQQKKRGRRGVGKGESILGAKSQQHSEDKKQKLNRSMKSGGISEKMKTIKKILEGRR